MMACSAKGIQYDPSNLRARGYEAEIGIQIDKLAEELGCHPSSKQ